MGQQGQGAAGQTAACDELEGFVLGMMDGGMEAGVAPLWSAGPLSLEEPPQAASSSAKPAPTKLLLNRAHSTACLLPTRNRLPRETVRSAFQMWVSEPRAGGWLNVSGDIHTSPDSD